jgi:hypothetical protein
LLADWSSHEVAKLLCFLNYFQRVQTKRPPGYIYIRRVRRTMPDATFWRTSTAPLIPFFAVTGTDGDGNDSGSSGGDNEQHVADNGAAVPAGRLSGIDGAADCVQVDFANKFIGGGVLCGGCVQEEIRFAACPEVHTGGMDGRRVTSRRAAGRAGGRTGGRTGGRKDELAGWCECSVVWQASLPP